MTRESRRGRPYSTSNITGRTSENELEKGVNFGEFLQFSNVNAHSGGTESTTRTQSTKRMPVKELLGFTTALSNGVGVNIQALLLSTLEKLPRRTLGTVDSRRPESSSVLRRRTIGARALRPMTSAGAHR
jgi:hypothetical protein